MYNTHWAVCSIIVMGETEAKNHPTQNEESKVLGWIVSTEHKNVARTNKS